MKIQATFKYRETIGEHLDEIVTRWESADVVGATPIGDDLPPWADPGGALDFVIVVGPQQGMDELPQKGDRLRVEEVVHGRVKGTATVVSVDRSTTVRRGADVYTATIVAEIEEGT